jgi:prefoldin subunit 5
LIEKQNQITCPKCSEVFHVEHDHKNIEEIQSKLVALKKEIQETESGIKDLAKEVVSLRAIIEKSQIISDGIVAQGKTLADIVQNKRQTLILRRSEGFTQGDDLVFVQQLNTLKNAKSNASLELATSKNKTKTKMTNLQTELEGLYDFVSKISMYQNAQKEVETLSKQLKELQSTKNEFEQLEMEVKILEETWLRKIDENVASAFGENIKFKMFENNASNDNIAPTCEMYVKDSNGRWVNTINGINTGHGVPRLVEFITIVKKRLGIRDGLLLIDFFESIGKQAMEELLGYGQQIVATAVVKNQFELKKEDL